MRRPTPRTARAGAASLALGFLLAMTGLVPDEPRPVGRVGDESAVPHRSPIALAIAPDGSRLLTANQTSDSVTLVDPKSGKVLAEAVTGREPSGVAFSPDATRAVVAHWSGYDLAVLAIGDDSIEVVSRVEVGPEPRGVAIGPDGRTAYVAVGVANQVVRIDLDRLEVTGRLDVGREPRGIAIAPDGSKMAVGNARAGSITLVDLEAWDVIATVPTLATNLRQVAFGPGDGFAYAAGMENRGFATTRNHIDLGWVLGQRVVRVPIDGQGRFATLSLDVQGQAAADAFGLAWSSDGRFLAVGLGGTHEVMLFRADGKRLPFRTNGARDLIAPELLRDDGRFRRVELGGRPTELAFDPDGRTLYAANYLDDSIQVIDAEAGTLLKSIDLGGPSEISLARRGEAIFHDATRSFNQWYSCNTCHADGHTGGLDFDTMNDGWQDQSTSHERSRKKVPSLRRVAETGPWTWHGWQDRLDDAMFESFTKSMQGPEPAPEDIEAIVAYLGTLDYPPNPYRAPDGSFTEAARRGEAVFRSSKAACSQCHSGPEFTDGEVHDVGLGERGDRYEGHNPPSLRGLYDKDPYLHDGRSATLREAMTDWHGPDRVTGLGELSESELEDLLIYLREL